MLKYDVKKTHKRDVIKIADATNATSNVGVAFIGAGSYAQGQLLPNLPNDIRRVGVMTNSGATSKRVAERFHFEMCTPQ